ncbi:hypothetical protein I5M27_04735 [Adhaeribacter sp. BT258]|uniref:Lipoprotein n=1 Tax=Adhaeribacter terrigena TaxID=2793070 RepID=A0ABS1BZ00_9BACT|nr:hypothetical protein [Adhaeribacter terrigena]
MPVLFFTACSSDTKTQDVNAVSHPETDTVAVPKPDPKVVEAEQYSLAPGRAGKIRVNMPTDSLKKMIPAENLKAVQRELEGEPYTAYELRNPKTGNQLLLLAEENCKNTCSIFRIRVLSPKFKTEKGIRVGSTFAEVKNAYPLSFIGLGETDFVAVSDKNKMTFTLDISNFPPKFLDRIVADDIPDSTRVTSIMLF